MTKHTVPLVKLSAVGEIARRTGASIHQVEYIIRSRGIEPAFRAGNARVFGEPDVVRISQELSRIQADREVRP